MPPAKLSPWLSTQGASRPAADSYQVFSQPVFAAVERSVCHRKGSLLATTGRWGFRIITRSLCGFAAERDCCCFMEAVVFTAPAQRHHVALLPAAPLQSGRLKWPRLHSG